MSWRGARTRSSRSIIIREVVVGCERWQIPSGSSEGLRH